MMIRTITTAITTLLLLLASSVQAAGDIERGEHLAYDCISCHGMEGEGNFESPPIAGLDEEYIVKQLRDFCKGKESMDGMMTLYTEDRSDQEMQDLAAYWASRPKPAALPQ
ncbi:MAG: cytochrome c [Lysobacterales bacterium]|jgi:cytochrome c553